MSSQTWNPSMSYRQPSHRPSGTSPTDLEAYCDESIVTYWRQTKNKAPNYRFSAEVANVVRISNTIDMIDANPRALDYIIWGATHPSDIPAGINAIVENPALIDLLLIRQFKAHGGIVLPPLQSARQLQETHERVVMDEVIRGLTWSHGRTMMQYPNWRDSRGQEPPPGFSAATTRAGRGNAMRGGRGGGAAGRGVGGRGGY